MLLAGAAVSKVCLAENALDANMLGNFGQVPECLWANFSGSPNEKKHPLPAVPLAITGEPEGHRYTKTYSIITATNY